MYTRHTKSRTWLFAKICSLRIECKVLFPSINTVIFKYPVLERRPGEINTANHDHGGKDIKNLLLVDWVGTVLVLLRPLPGTRRAILPLVDDRIGVDQLRHHRPPPRRTRASPKNNRHWWPRWRKYRPRGGYDVMMTSLVSVFRP